MKSFEQWVKESVPSKLEDTPGTEAHRAKYGKMVVLHSRYGSQEEQDMAEAELRIAAEQAYAYAGFRCLTG